MKKSLLIGLVLIILFGLTIVVVLLLGRENNVPKPNTQTQTFPVNSSTNNDQFPSNITSNVLAFHEVGGGLSIDNESGREIIIRDFRNDTDVELNDSFAPESYAINPQQYSDQFSIFFYGNSAKFQVAITTNNVNTALVNLQTYLMNKLDISAAETCYLKGSIAVVAMDDLDPDLVGTELELPNC